MYNYLGDYMYVKIFDEEHEIDLEEKINTFISEKEVIDIKYEVATSITDEEQVYCYSALIIYKKTC